jgi:hypothetical protein
MAVFWAVALCSLFTDVSEVFAASIVRVNALMMEAASISEMLVKFYQNIWRYNPEIAILILAAVRT